MWFFNRRDSLQITKCGPQMTNDCHVRCSLNIFAECGKKETTEMDDYDSHLCRPRWTQEQMQRLASEIVYWRWQINLLCACSCHSKSSQDGPRWSIPSHCVVRMSDVIGHVWKIGPRHLWQLDCTIIYHFVDYIIILKKNVWVYKDIIELLDVHAKWEEHIV